MTTIVLDLIFQLASGATSAGNILYNETSKKKAITGLLSNTLHKTGLKQ